MKLDSISFEKADPNSYPDLNRLSLQSRNVWAGTPGYFEGYLEQSRNLIDITSDYIQKNIVCVGYAGNLHKQIFGFFAFKIEENQKKILDHFWIDPHFMKKGLGQKMFQQALYVAKLHQWDSFELYSDPPAEGFYLKMGAKKIGEVPSRISGGPIFPALKVEVRASN